MKGYIYGLYKNNDDNDIFYIGATTNPNGRIKAHRNTYPFYAFDCRIELSILEEIEFIDINELRMLETYWIHQFIAWGFKLTNRHLGYGVDVIHLQIINDIFANRPSKIWPYVESNFSN